MSCRLTLDEKGQSDEDDHGAECHPDPRSGTRHRHIVIGSTPGLPGTTSFQSRTHEGRKVTTENAVASRGNPPSFPPLPFFPSGTVPRVVGGNKQRCSGDRSYELLLSTPDGCSPCRLQHSPQPRRRQRLKDQTPPHVATFFVFFNA